jgi:hypothetical protein
MVGMLVGIKGTPGRNRRRHCHSMPAKTKDEQDHRQDPAGRCVYPKVIKPNNQWSMP